MGCFVSRHFVLGHYVLGHFACASLYGMECPNLIFQDITCNSNINLVMFLVIPWNIPHFRFVILEHF